MRFSRAFFLLAILLPACQTDTPTSSGGNGNGNGNGGTVYKYITLKVTCGNQERGTVVGVAIFDESDGRRLISGSSVATGEFCSQRKLSTEGSYRIEFYEYPDRTCILWVFNISYDRNPWLWSDNCTPKRNSNFHFGVCEGNSETSDCWGD